MKGIAEKRIKKLFSIAKEEGVKRPVLAKRYVKLARELARKAQVKIPIRLMRSFCKKCDAPYTSLSRVRTNKGFVVYNCFRCGVKRRFKIS